MIRVLIHQFADCFCLEARDVRCHSSVDSVASVISRLVCAQLVMYDAEPFVCLLTLLPVLSRGLCVRSS